MTIARYAVTEGLAGCYMPDTHDGAWLFSTRRDFAEFIRGELASFGYPRSAFAQVNIRRTWRFIVRNGSSSAHFKITHGARELAFHGLTEEEYNDQTKDDC